MKGIWGIFSFSLSFLLLGCLTVSAEETFYQPHVDFRYKLGNKRTLGSSELFIPIVQDESALLFTDIRGVVDNNGANEGNVGIGYRQVKHDAIFGLYGFADRRRSQFDNYFSQMTIGAEILSEDWDFRTNLYMPLSQDGKVVSQSPSTAYLAGSGIYVDSTVTKEKALRGYDAEIGYRLFGETRAYIGGYHFYGGGGPNVKGVRGRLEYQANDYFKFGLESQHDHVRGNNSYAEVRLSIPFGPKPTKKATGIRTRMTQPIVRDIDIVSTPRSQTTSYPVLNSTTGTQQNIWYVDNSGANGDGSKESPFNNLADATTAADNYDIIYVAYGDGTSTNMDSGITLNKTGVKLLGSGIDFSIDLRNYTLPGGIAPFASDPIVTVPATTAPKITNTAGDGITVAADNVEVGGLTLTDTVFLNNAVTITNQTGTNLHDITSTGWIKGVVATYSDGSVHTLNIDNLTMAGAFQNSIQINVSANSQFTGTINDVTVNNTVIGDGLAVGGNGSGKVNLTVTSSAFNNGVSGVDIDFSTNAAQNEVILSDITANNNSWSGISFNANSSADSSLTITSGSFDNNTTNGIEIITLGTAINNTALLQGNTISNSNTAGINIAASGNSTLDVDTINNTALTGFGTAILFYSQANNAVVTTNITGNNLQGATFASAYFLVSGPGGSMSAKAENNILANSTYSVFANNGAASSVDDIDFGGGTQGSTGQNSLYNSGGKEIFAVLNNSTLKMENNWWGVATGLDQATRAFIFGAGASVDSTPFLTTDPN